MCWKVIFVFLCTISTQSYAEDLNHLLERLGGVESFYFGSGIEIYENVIVTLGHVLNEKTGLLPETNIFVEGTTIFGVEDDSLNKHFREIKEEYNSCASFGSVLIARNAAGVFVIRKDQSGYFAEKAVRVIDYGNDGTLHEDEVKIIVLNQDVSLPPKELGDYFLSDESWTSAPFLSRVSIRFSMWAKSQVNSWCWQSSGDKQVLLHPYCSKFPFDTSVSKLRCGAGMSGGGLFAENKLVGLLSGNAGFSGMFCDSNLDYSMLTENGWKVELVEDGKYRFSSDQVEIIKRIDFDRLIQVISTVCS